MPQFLVFGHRNPDTDAIGAAIALADLESTLGADIEAVALGGPNIETRYALDYFGLAAPRVIERAAPEVGEVMLVDHNERQHSVPDIAEVTVRAVVDHHRVANFTSIEPLYFRVEPVGCTCTIIHRMYAENGVDIPAPIAGMMVSAIVSDTLLLVSPTTTDADRRAATDLARIAGVDLHDYGTALLRAGTDLGDASAAELIRRDAKIYTFGATSVRIGQLNTVEPAVILDRRDEFLAAMSAEREATGDDLYLLFVTDVTTSDSDLLVTGEPIGAVERALDLTITDGHAFAKGIVSRKKQIVPPLTRELAPIRVPAPTEPGRGAAT